MKILLACIALLTFTGCTTSRKADLKAHEAYLEGQQQAMSEAQQAKTPSVTVYGSVRNQVVPWTEGMTVARAIVAAEYQGLTSPRTIRLLRNRVPTDIKAADLLRGKDVSVQPGDQIVILY